MSAKPGVLGSLGSDFVVPVFFNMSAMKLIPRRDVLTSSDHLFPPRQKLTPNLVFPFKCLINRQFLDRIEN